MPKYRVAFVNTHPIQYFAPLYAYLNAAPDVSITAFYLSDISIRGGFDPTFGRPVKWDVDLLAGYDARFIKGAEQRNNLHGFFSILAPSIWREIRTGDFDAVVVHGHTPAALLIAAASAKLAGVPVFTRGDTHLGLARSSLKGVLRAPVMGAYYRQLNGVLAVGSANGDFYRAMGVPEAKIFSVPYTVDNSRFVAASSVSKSERVKIRASIGVKDDHPVILYAAKYSRRKHPDDLIRAAALLRQSGMAFHVLMVGSGEMDAELRALVSSLRLDNVRFTGFVNQGELPRIYAASDVFVLPSDNEPWGLAVNEAMCAGLPIVLSDEVGCVADLVRDGENGATFPAGDVERFAAALRPLIANADLRRHMGAVSRDIIDRWSYAECLTGLRAALASTVS